MTTNIAPNTISDHAEKFDAGFKVKLQASLIVTSTFHLQHQRSF